MERWKKNILKKSAGFVAGDYGEDLYNAVDKHFNDGEQKDFSERFAVHKIQKTKHVEIFILIFVFGFVVSMFNELFGNLILIGSMFFAAWAIKEFLSGREEKQKFCDYENKLINLMIQTPKIPDKFCDGNVWISCDEIEDKERYVVFSVGVRDVVGALEFIESNCDKWAANFGDRDGAKFEIINTGLYRLTFDLMGKQNEQAGVSW